MKTSFPALSLSNPAKLNTSNSRTSLEDADIREAYAAAIAEMPLKVGPPKGKLGEKK